MVVEAFISGALMMKYYNAVEKGNNVYVLTATLQAAI